MKLLAATGNKGKLDELKKILAGEGIEIISPDEVGGIPEVVEDKDTFEGNACKKALETAIAKNMTVFADDSGLEVEALNGEPGIYSARYADTNEARISKLLKNLKGESNRKANFTCVIALASPDGIIGTAEGKVFGTIAEEPYGNGGFGYDPVFIPEGFDKTFAEMDLAMKNKISHRSRAVLKLKEFLQNYRK